MIRVDKVEQIYINLLTLMSKESGRPSINMELVKKANPKMDEVYLTDPSSTYLSAKRRKSKFNPNRKNNEQLIKEQHEEIMQYIKGVNHRVSDIIESQEAEFLTAYQRHVKKVREEMEEIRAQSQSNSTSEKSYLQKIDCLEKELVIFRNQSLNLFNKIAQKDKQIFDLSMKVKELTSNNETYEKSIKKLTKKNKELEVFIARMKQRYEQNIQKNQIKLPKREVHSQNKRYNISTPSSKQRICSSLRKKSEDLRPFTSEKSYNSSTFALKVQSNKKQDKISDFQQIKQNIDEHINLKNVNEDVSMRIGEENHDASITNKHFASSCSPHNYRISNKHRKRSTYRIIQDEILKLKSQQMADKNQCLAIFKECVDVIKKDIIRRSNTSSLNFFKQNGPKSFVEFKKMDYYSIFELLIKNQSILSSIYNLIFNPHPQ